MKLAQLRGDTPVTCIEEPEIHVHPTGVKSLVKTLKDAVASGQQQVVVTTHSPEVINQTDFDQLVCVRKDGQRSVATQTNPAVVGFTRHRRQQIQHRILRQDQRGALFLSKRVLLVEGPYDRLVVEMLDRDGSIGLLEADVAVLDVGGKGSFGAYHELLTHLERPHGMLVDLDAFVQQTGPGVLLDALMTSGALRGFSQAHQQQFLTAAPSRRRTQIEQLSESMRPRRVALAAHGHHDIWNAIHECVAHATFNEKQSAYVALGGLNPNPSLRDLDEFLEREIRTKDARMVAVVDAFPVRRFARLIRPLRSAISHLR